MGGVSGHLIRAKILSPSAIASFDTTLQFQPNSPKAWDKRGYTLVKLGRDNEVIASFNKALEIQL